MPPEFTRRIGVYGLCVTDNAILLTRLSRREPDAGMWTLPGGGREPGESHLDTLAREFAEETSLHPEVGRLLGARTRTYPPNARRGRLHVVQYVYQARASGAPAVREVGGSTADAAWVELHEAAELALVDLARWAVARAARSDARARQGGVGTIRA